MSEPPIIIVGAGPVGLTSALGLELYWQVVGEAKAATGR